MDLINQTPVPAKLLLGAVAGGSARFGILVAKATFAYGPGERVQLVTQDPHPLYEKDKNTDLGFLPSDLAPRRDSVFEVIVLGTAYAGSGQEAVARPITLAVGSVTRQLMVFGDRHWEPGGLLRGPKISDPAPFQRMPLTYDRAWGGSCPVHFDEHTVLDVEDRLNKYGRGFDAEKLAKDLAASFKSPDGYPQLVYQRKLPNLENPATLIRAWKDSPEPYCWATVPEDIAFRMIRVLRKFKETGQPPTRDEAVDQTCHRAHPDWIIPPPPPGARITMTGLSAEGTISFPLPGLRVLADYVLGGRSGTRELTPHLLMLLPEARRFYIVYRTSFTMDVQPEMERGFRLRLAEGSFERAAAPAPALKGA
jgi:hypothetical protein